MVPAWAKPWAKVRLSWLPGRMMPRQLGPIRRMPWRRAFSSAARSSARAARTGLGEAAGNHDRVLAAGAAAGVDDVGDGGGLGTDHGDIEALRDGVDRRVALLAEHRFVPGIDEIQLALVARIQHVADQGDAYRVRRFRGTDDGDRLRFEEGVQVVTFVMHGNAPQRRGGVFSMGWCGAA
jgi:hypothetical protein